LLIVALLGGGLLVREGYPTLLAGDDPGSDAVAVPEVSAAELDPAFIEDSLLGPRLWTATSDAEGECLFAGGLVVRRTTRGPYRCDGPDDALSIDQRVEVGVRLLRADSCASIWFRFREFLGYQVRVCDDRVLVGWHKSRKVQVYRTFPLDDHLEIGGPATRIRVAAYGDTVAVARDGVPLGTVTLTDPDITSGKVSLGIFTRDGADVEDAEYAVVFNDVKIWSTGP
jgi:hypothetical protein